MAANKEIDQQIAGIFLSLRDNWKNQTAYLSSSTEIVNNPNYQQVIQLGEKVLPLIFEDLKKEPDHWFYALNAITGEDPVKFEDRGNLNKMTQSWLEWWRTKNGE